PLDRLQRQHAAFRAPDGATVECATDGGARHPDLPAALEPDPLREEREFDESAEPGAIERRSQPDVPELDAPESEVIAIEPERASDPRDASIGASRRLERDADPSRLRRLAVRQPDAVIARERRRGEHA